MLILSSLPQAVFDFAKSQELKAKSHRECAAAG
jgi:hypothetical protein